MLTEKSPGGRTPTILNNEEHAAFGTNYIFVIHQSRGVVLIYTKATGESMCRSQTSNGCTA